MLPSDPVEEFETQGRIARVYHHGREPIKVVVLDNYLTDPDAMVDLAVQGPDFAPNGPFYPGIRAPVPPSSFQTLLGPLAEILPRCFDYSGRAGLRECNFSLVTTPSDQLQPIQRLPHFDSLEYGRVAALLYLGQGDRQGGTAFYRQRSTGFESVDAGRFAAFEAALHADVAHHGLPDAAYIDETSPIYELIGRHEARFNRMIVYLSSSLHCAHIPKDFAFDPNPATGRLTVNAFLGMD
ncbi:DUF6445 family protein [Aquidulcibacter sp.]|uniref:DUF6445 family protein n=1 Tax=Aquidulcibacter sp. TaxID=2052990 RepID=UPI0025C2FA8D|nr:DUF6445 family protein [Aquidulcibacter sp.]